MSKGEKSILTCAPDYAYGGSAIGPIPANSTLNFEVELIGWKKAEPSSGFPLILIILIAAIGSYFYFKR